MDPPQRPSSLRRTTSTQNLKPLPTLDLLQDNSPEETKVLRGAGKDKHITSMQVSGMEWTQHDDIISQSTTRLQVELAECVETKTVTTTTTTKRSYPPLIVRPPRSLDTLDAREYPLALKPTPHELTNFSFEIDGKIVHLCEDAPTSTRSTVGVFHRLSILGLESPC
jgi:F-box and WD-40 domain protein CDC4